MTNTDDTPAENPYPNGPTKGFLPGKTYDKLKWLALVFLPAFGSFYFALGNVWQFPNVEKVVGTIVLIETFLGALLGLSTRAYNASDARFAGEIVVHEGVNDEGDPMKTFTLDVGDLDLWKIDKNKELTFKVKPSP